MNKINSWYTLPFIKYIKLKELQESENDELNYLINLVHICYDTSIEEIRQLKKKDFDVLVSELSFLHDEIDIKNAKHKWKIKSMENITMDDFINYQALQNEIDNYPAILSFMSGEDEDTINQMSTVEVLNGFFLLKKKLLKYITRLPRYLIWTKTKNKMKKFLHWRKK